MVLQVCPHTLQRHLHADAVLRQVFRRTDPGQHQQLRRIYHATTEDYLACRANMPCLAPVATGDAYRARARHIDPLDHRARRDCQVAPFLAGMQIGRCRTCPTPLPDRHLQAAKPLLHGTIVVLGPAMAIVPPRRGKRLDQRVAVAAELRADRPVAAAMGIRTTLPGFLPLEVGQHRIRSPALQARLR